MAGELFDNILNRINVDAEFKELLSHSKNYLSANFFLKALTFFTLPIFTRILSPEDFGLISLYSTIAGILSIFMFLGLDGSLYRYYFEKNNNFPEFLGSNLIYISIYNIIIFLSIYIYREQISKLISTDVNILLLAALTCVVGIPSSLMLIYFQCSLKSKHYSYSNVIKYSSITILSIIFVILLDQNKYLGRIYSEIFIIFILSVFFIPSLFRIIKINYKYKYFKYTLLIGIPLLPHSLSQVLLNFSDRLIINIDKGQTDVGLYTFAYNIGMVMNAIAMGMNQSWAPIFYEKLKNENYTDIKMLSSKYIKIIFCIGSFLIIFPKYIVIIMADPRYHSTYTIIPIIISSYLFVYLYTIYANYSFFFKKNYIISVLTLISAAINIVLNIIFIPIYGYKFASISTLVSFSILFILHYLNARYFIKVKQVIPIKNTLIYFTVIFFCLIYFYIMVYLETNTVIEIFTNILVFVISVFFIVGYKKLFSIFKI